MFVFFILDARVGHKQLKNIIKTVRNVLFFFCHGFVFVCEGVRIFFFGFDFLPIISFILAHVFLMSCLYFEKQ